MLYYVLLFIQFLLTTSIYSSRPVLTLFADSIGVSAATIGLLVSCYALIPMLLALTLGKWLDRYGAYRMVLSGSVGMIIAFLIPVISPTLPALFLSQFLMGFSMVCVHVSLQKTVGNLPEDRDKLIAGFSVASGFGELVGPLLGGFSYEYFGFDKSFILSSACILLALVITFLLGKISWKSGAAAADAKHISLVSSITLIKHANLRKALIASGLAIYAKDLFVSYFPLYGNKIGMTASTIGLVISVMGGASIIVRLLQFPLVKKFGRGNVLTGTLIMSGIAYLMIPMSDFIVAICFFSLMLGLGLGLGQPISMVYALDYSPKDRQGEVLGIRLTFNRACQFLAPVLFGSIGSMGGILPIFSVSGIILLCSSFFIRIKEKQPLK